MQSRTPFRHSFFLAVERLPCNDHAIVVIPSYRKKVPTLPPTPDEANLLPVFPKPTVLEHPLQTWSTPVVPLLASLFRTHSPSCRHRRHYRPDQRTPRNFPSLNHRQNLSAAGSLAHLMKYPGHQWNNWSQITYQTRRLRGHPCSAASSFPKRLVSALVHALHFAAMATGRSHSYILPSTF